MARGRSRAPPRGALAVGGGSMVPDCRRLPFVASPVLRGIQLGEPLGDVLREPFDAALPRDLHRLRRRHVAERRPRRLELLEAVGQGRFPLADVRVRHPEGSLERPPRTGLGATGRTEAGRGLPRSRSRPLLPVPAASNPPPPTSPPSAVPRSCRFGRQAAGSRAPALRRRFRSVALPNGGGPPPKDLSRQLTGPLASSPVPSPCVSRQRKKRQYTTK